MRRSPHRWPRVAAGTALAVLGLVACGGGNETGTARSPALSGEAGPAPGTGQPGGSQAPPATSAGPSGARSEIPDVTVLDVASGEELALGSIVPSERPVLVWFWAPH